MKAFVTSKPSNNTSTRTSFKPHPAPIFKVKSVSESSTGNVQIQRKPSCPCDGGCPRCRDSLFIQAKLKINEPGDKYEQEADRVASEVMRMPDSEIPGISQDHTRIQRKCTPCASGGELCPGCEEEEEGLVQRKVGNADPSKKVRTGSNANDTSVPDSFTNSLGPGQPLPESVRAFLEPRFGHDFSHVRVHTDSQASESTHNVNALAYTIGHDVVFGAGQYAPETGTGKKLLAHELTHVVQQQNKPLFVQRQDETEENGGGGITISLNVTPQISWAVTALFLRPVREEDVWACLGGVPEYDKPRILMNYFIQFRDNSAFAQIDAQRPPDIDRDTYLRGVFEYLWSLIRHDLMVLIESRIRRNPSFRAKVERASSEEGCARMPYLPEGSGIVGA